jgi:hypothetical protein
MLIAGLNARVNVRVRHLAPDGTLLSEEFVHNLVTDVGCAHIADQLASTHDEAEMGWMAIGTGTTSPAAGDTALETELSRVALTSRTQGSGADDHKVTYVASFTGVTGAVTEAGILNAASAGTLLARVTFGAKNMVPAETLAFDWELTIADDGA